VAVSTAMRRGLLRGPADPPWQQPARQPPMQAPDRSAHRLCVLRLCSASQRPMRPQAGVAAASANRTHPGYQCRLCYILASRNSRISCVVSEASLDSESGWFLTKDTGSRRRPGSSVFA
jgi:hypothetical protein